MVSATLLWSNLWEFVKVLKLTQNMWVMDDPDSHMFSSWLLNVGHGRGLTDDETIQLPHGMITPDIDTLVGRIYPGIQSSSPPTPEYFVDRIILSPRNSNVVDLNGQILDMMPGEAEIFTSVDTVVDEAGADDGISGFNIPPEFLWTLNPPGLPPSDLGLKPGCPLILLRNLCPARGLCNRTLINPNSGNTGMRSE